MFRLTLSHLSHAFTTGFCHQFIYTTTFTQMHVPVLLPSTTPLITYHCIYLLLYIYWTNVFVNTSYHCLSFSWIQKYITNSTTLSPGGVYTTDHSPLLKRIGNLSVVSFVLLFTPITSGLPRLKHATNHLLFTTTHFYDNDFLDCFISQSTVASTIHEQNLSPATTLFYEIFFTTVHF